jgi:GAF domain-containing protein
VQQPNAGFQVPAGADAIRSLAAITAELAAAETMDTVIDIAVLHMADAARAAVSTLLLVDGDELVVVGHAGVAESTIVRWTRIPIANENPASEAIRTRSPVIATTAEQMRARYPQMAAVTPTRRSVICLPLNTGEETLGSIGLTFEQNWSPGPDELDFLMIAADSCAQTIRRVRATAEAADRATHLRFLADASAEMSRSLDYSTTLANVARLAVPELADWCAVDLLVNGVVTTLAVAHADPAKVAWARQLREQFPVDQAASAGSVNVIRTGQSEFYPNVTDEMLLASARGARHLELMQQQQMHSVLAVPLLAGRDPIGAITFCRAETPHAFTKQDLTLAEDLGRRAGTAIENARLHAQTASVALQFQQAALPQNLDAIEGWEVASYYTPNGNTEVGGDFFDAVRLADGRLSVFIGDVVGHGVHAAAAMAQVRAALRAFLTIDPDPVAVVSKVDNMYEQLGIPPFVTLVYGLLHPDGTFQFVNAGHYPPMVVTAAGTTRYLEGAPRPPIGVRPAAVPSLTAYLDSDDILLLYTDGVVERREDPFEAGMKALAGHATALPAASLTGWISALIAATTLDLSTDDDVAAIAVRAR